jgi:class 3 adenylate cyclase
VSDAPRSRTHGFLFADLRGYTAYVEAHGDAAAAALLAVYRALVREVVSRHDGAEIKTEGDSFYVVFPAASDAVRCGLALVTAAAVATSQDQTRPIRVGVGVHAGETAETAEGYVGSAVNLAARLCAIAGPSEVLVSDTVRGLTRTSGEVTFTARGRKHLKGIAEPMAVYAAAAAIPNTARTSGPTRSAIRGRLLGFGDPRRAAIASAGAAGAVALAALLVAGAFGGAFTATPHPTESSGRGSGSQVGQGSPNMSASASSAGGTIFGNTGIGEPLKPDTYTAVELPGTPTLTITDEGWSVRESGVPYLVLERTSSPDDRVTILWPTNLAGDACGFTSIEIGAAPEAQFLAWTHAAKGLRLSAPLARTFGDLSTYELDVSIVDQDACKVTTPFSVAVASGGDRLALNAGDSLRLEVSSRDGLILILIEAPSAAEFAAFKQLAEKILNTLTFP